MRPDMAKVVTERPRRGHGEASLKTGRRLRAKDVVRDEDGLADADYGPIRTKVSRRGQYGYNAKEFSDLLGPLQKYLRTQVGRPWDKVYSELTAHLDRRSLAGRHIWSHVTSEVELHGVERDGAVYYPTAQYSWRHDGQVDGLYVHPRTRLLCYKPERRPRYRPWTDPNVVKLDRFTSLERVRGLWYRCHYAVVDRYVPPQKMRWGGLTAERWVEELVCQRKKQLSKAELKDYGVANGPVAKP